MLPPFVPPSARAAAEALPLITEFVRTPRSVRASGEAYAAAGHGYADDAPSSQVASEAKIDWSVGAVGLVPPADAPGLPSIDEFLAARTPLPLTVSVNVPESFASLAPAAEPEVAVPAIEEPVHVEEALHVPVAEEPAPETFSGVRAMPVVEDELVSIDALRYEPPSVHAAEFTKAEEAVEEAPVAAHVDTEPEHEPVQLPVQELEQESWAAERTEDAAPELAHEEPVYEQAPTISAEAESAEPESAEPEPVATERMDEVPEIAAVEVASSATPAVSDMGNDAEWVNAERDAFDWGSLAGLAATPLHDDQRAEDDWAATNWDAGAHSDAEHLASLLSQVARRVRTGELKVDGGRGLSAEAALAATLAALLKSGE